MSSEAESEIVTRLLVPLNESAPPNLPPFVQVAFTREPSFPLPDASPAVVPLPSSKPNAATRPAGGVHAPCLDATGCSAAPLSPHAADAAHARLKAITWRRERLFCME